mmetsp:Transcript_3821/g.13514  ORF Transcript_3821/g.13514 Transcript_3821/m.13514 type:complete len:201 (+) Transcript_3821:1339-1941(+)
MQLAHLGRDLGQTLAAGVEEEQGGVVGTGSLLDDVEELEDHATERDLAGDHAARPQDGREVHGSAKHVAGRHGREEPMVGRARRGGVVCGLAGRARPAVVVRHRPGAHPLPSADRLALQTCRSRRAAQLRCGNGTAVGCEGDDLLHGGCRRDGLLEEAQCAQAAHVLLLLAVGRVRHHVAANEQVLSIPVGRRRLSPLCK